MAAAPASQGRRCQTDIHHVGGQQGVGGSAAEMDGNNLIKVSDDTFSIKEAQSQLLFPAWQAHEHLKRLAREADFQRLLHRHLIMPGFGLTMAPAPYWKCCDRFGHNQRLRIRVYGFCRRSMQKPTKVESSGTLNLAELSFPYPHHITISLRESDKFLSWQDRAHRSPL
jgi:hypothetical protein